MQIYKANILGTVYSNSLIEQHKKTVVKKTATVLD